MLALVLLAAALGAQDPGTLDAGRRALEAGDLARAEDLFRRHTTSHPRSAEGFSNLAVVCARREKYEDAVQLYRQALKLNPKLIPIHFNLAVSLGKLERHDEAAKHLRAFLKSYPDEPRARQLLGLCLIESGDLAGAIAELETAYRVNPSDGSIHYALSYAHARAGNEDRAAEILRNLDTNPAQSKLIQGLIEYRRQRFPESKALFQEVLQLSPKVASAYAALGRLELRENNDAEAIRFLEKALELNPSDAESAYQAGVLHARNGRVEQGLSLLRRAIALRPSYGDPHYQIGRIALEREDHKTALTELETARRLLPRQEAVRLMLGRTYQALGREREAKAEFAEVRRLKAAAIENARQRVEVDPLMKP
jgi:tetratricopeptide (TPR) repeat protein